jgi:hypothetical protein
MQAMNLNCLRYELLEGYLLPSFSLVSSSPVSNPTFGTSICNKRWWFATDFNTRFLENAEQWPSQYLPMAPCWQDFCSLTSVSDDERRQLLPRLALADNASFSNSHYGCHHHDMPFFSGSPSKRVALLLRRNFS